MKYQLITVALLLTTTTVTTSDRYIYAKPYHIYDESLEEICIFTPDLAIQHLISEEGWNTGKWDYKQYTTGHGTKADYPGQILSTDEAYRRLNVEYNIRYKMIRNKYPYISVSKQRILACFIFNTKIGPTMNNLIKTERFNDVGYIMLNYIHVHKDGNKIALEGLLERRKKEKLLWDHYQ